MYVGAKMYLYDDFAKKNYVFVLFQEYFPLNHSHGIYLNTELSE